MRFLWTLFCLAFLATAHAKIEQNALYGVSINLPDSAGWVKTKDVAQLPQQPDIGVLALANHPARQALISLSVLRELPSQNLSEPATVQAIEALLRRFGYETRGNATINVTGRSWKQFFISANSAGRPVSGLVRCTQANDQIFMLTILSGGTGAVQDTELQASAATVQFRAPAAVVAAATPGSTPAAPVANPAAQPLDQPTSPGGAPVATAEKPKSKEEELIEAGPFKFTREQVRTISMVAGGLFVLILLLRIISGGKKPPPPPPPATQRRGL